MKKISLRGITGIELILIIIALYVGVTAYQNGAFNNFKLGAVTGLNFNGCTWQPDYYAVTCQSITSISQQLSSSQRFTCPIGADVDKCIVTQASPAGSFYNLLSCGSQNFLGCNDCNSIGVNDQVGLSPGRILCGSYGTATVQVYKKELRNCGTAACSSPSGQPISGVQGCSWHPPSGGFYDIFTNQKLGNVIDTVPVGQSYFYVYSQHLVSCSQECKSGVNDLSCSVPVGSLRTGTTNYNGKTYNYYVSGSNVNIVGCKESSQDVCLLYNDDGTTCSQTRKLGECGTIAVQSAGQCSQNSDCGDTTRYFCNFDSSQLKGTCQPTGTGPPPQCQFDYDCSQTAPTCNAGQYGTQKCVNGQCTVNSQKVACCSTGDCQTGYFCNANHQCQQSQYQKPQCPAGRCCENDQSYQDRTCADMTGGSKIVCCATGTQNSGSCVSKLNECGAGSLGTCDWWNLPCHIGKILGDIGNFIITLGIIIVIILGVVLLIFIFKK